MTFAPRPHGIHDDIDKAIRDIDPTDTDALTDAARALLADDDWIDPLIDRAAAALSRDPRFTLPFRALHNDIRSGLCLFERPGFRMSIDVVNAVHLAAKKQAVDGLRSINFPSEIAVIRFVRGGDATLSFWEAAEIDHVFSAGSAGTCRPSSQRRIQDGELLIVDGRRQSFVIDHARPNLLVVQVTISTGAPVRVEYDSRSLAYVGCSAANDSDSRIQMVATLARLLDAPEAFPAIAALLDHPSFFVRWHAMREMLGIDAQAALPYLKLLATHDPHPDVRETALATLGLFGPAERRAA